MDWGDSKELEDNKNQTYSKGNQRKVDSQATE